MSTTPKVKKILDICSFERTVLTARANAEKNGVPITPQSDSIGKERKLSHDKQLSPTHKEKKSDSLLNQENVLKASKSSWQDPPPPSTEIVKHAKKKKPSSEGPPCSSVKNTSTEQKKRKRSKHESPKSEKIFNSCHNLPPSEDKREQCKKNPRFKVEEEQCLSKQQYSTGTYKDTVPPSVVAKCQVPPPSNQYLTTAAPNAYNAELSALSKNQPSESAEVNTPPPSLTYGSRYMKPQQNSNTNPPGFEYPPNPLPPSIPRTCSDAWPPSHPPSIPRTCSDAWPPSHPQMYQQPSADSYDAPSHPPPSHPQMYQQPSADSCDAHVRLYQEHAKQHQKVDQSTDLDNSTPSIDDSNWKNFANDWNFQHLQNRKSSTLTNQSVPSLPPSETQQDQETDVTFPSSDIRYNTSTTSGYKSYIGKHPSLMKSRQHNTKSKVRPESCDAEVSRILQEEWFVNRMSCKQDDERSGVPEQRFKVPSTVPRQSGPRDACGRILSAIPTFAELQQTQSHYNASTNDHGPSVIPTFNEMQNIATGYQTPPSVSRLQDKRWSYGSAGSQGSPSPSNRSRFTGKPRSSNSSPASREIRISKMLSGICRHKIGEGSESLLMVDGGYFFVDEILNTERFKRLNVSRSDIEEIVRSNDKQRFSLKDYDGNLTICANQGHSIEVQGLELTPITSASDYPTVVHGTFEEAWQSIRLQGLSNMGRNHIHFARGLPKNRAVISGMRRDCEIAIYIDMGKAIADGILFFKSKNDVLLSPGNAQGVLPACYFNSVIRLHGCRELIKETLPVATSSGLEGGERRGDSSGHHGDRRGDSSGHQGDTRHDKRYGDRESSRERRSDDSDRGCRGDNSSGKHRGDNNSGKHRGDNNSGKHHGDNSSDRHRSRQSGDRADGDDNWRHRGDN